MALVSHAVHYASEQLRWVVGLLGLPILVAILAAVVAAQLAVAAFAVYQLFFSPLRHVPGPKLAAIFPFGILYAYARRRLPQYLFAMHQQYGPVVRLMPWGVSVSGGHDMAAFRQVYSTHAFRKHNIYKHLQVAEDQTFSTIDVDLSKLRKRQLTPAFTPNTLASMEALIRERGMEAMITRWDRLIRASDDKRAAVDLFDEFIALTGNVIGRLAFGSDMDMIDPHTGAFHPLVKWVQSLNRLIYSFFLTPHKIRAISRRILPHDMNNLDKIVSFARERIRVNAAREDYHPDILQMFMDAVDPETGAKLDIDSLIAECTVQIVAGVDTTAYTLNWTFDLLFQHPRVFRKLEAEILAHFPQKNSDSRIWYKDAKELPYLDAVILESMRFRTVAEMILPRTAPDGGRTIGGYYIPGGTSIGGTTRTIHRNPEVFDRPDEFIPERFLDGSEEQLALRRQSVVPFSIGVRACLGRQLALMELYTCIAALIREFEISPAQQPYIPRTEENFFLLAPKERSLPALVKARAS